MKKKLKEFTKKKLKELWESMNEIQGPEAWTPSSFGYYAFICLIFSIFSFIMEAYTLFWICAFVFIIWLVNFLLE